MTRHSLTLLAFLLACGDPALRPDAGPSSVDAGPLDGGPADGPREDLSASLELAFTEPPVPVPAGARFSADVAYDVHDATALDVFLPAAPGPVPLVIFIHGGGFTGGDKAAAYGDRAADIRAVLQFGAAYATINYRLLDPVDTDGVLKSLGDSRRALQFLRHHHAELGIDPARVVAYGGSAGAGTALWLGAHPEMADPTAADPIARESTRLRAVAILGSQSTYDVLAWPSEVFAEYGITADDMAAITGEQRLLSFYGAAAWEDLESDAIRAYRAEVDMLELLDASDAPVWIASGGRAVRPEDTGVLFHHPNHGDAVRRRCQEVGLEEVSSLPALGVASDEDMLSFFARQLRD